MLRVKGLVICFYLGWSGNILQFRQNIIKVKVVTLSLPSYSSALKRELNFCNGHLSLLYFWAESCEPFELKPARLHARHFLSILIRHRRCTLVCLLNEAVLISKRPLTTLAKKGTSIFNTYISKEETSYDIQIPQPEICSFFHW